jgi:hypothetical protein
VVRQVRKATEEATKGLSGKGSTIEEATKLSLQSMLLQVKKATLKTEEATKLLLRNSPSKRQK